MICNPCEGTGFTNIDQVPFEIFNQGHDEVLKWIQEQTEPHDVSVCNCCGDGKAWFGTPGEHYGPDDPQGPRGPYANNGGLCRCH